MPQRSLLPRLRMSYVLHLPFWSPTLSCEYVGVPVHTKLNLNFSCQSVSCGFDYSTNPRNQRREGKCFTFLMLRNVFFISVKISPEEAAFLLPGSQKKKKCLTNNKLTSLLQIFPANPPDFTEGPWVWRIKAAQMVLKSRTGNWLLSV